MKPNYTYNATVRRVLDGDTLDVVVQLWKGLEMTACLRLAHINAPELHSINPIEKQAGQASLKALVEKLGGNEGIPFPYDLTVKVLKQEKYGRWLSEIYLTPGSTVMDAARVPRDAPTVQSINQWMVEQGHAKPYQGGARELFPDNPFDEPPTS